MNKIDTFYGSTFPGMPSIWDLIRNTFLLIVVRLFQYNPVMIYKTQDLVLSPKVSDTRVGSFYFSARSLFGRHKSISLYCNFVSKLRKCFSFFPTVVGTWSIFCTCLSIPSQTSQIFILHSFH